MYVLALSIRGIGTGYLESHADHDTVLSGMCYGIIFSCIAIAIESFWYMDWWLALLVFPLGFILSMLIRLLLAPIFLPLCASKDAAVIFTIIAGGLIVYCMANIPEPDLFATSAKQTHAVSIWTNFLSFWFLAWAISMVSFSFIAIKAGNVAIGERYSSGDNVGCWSVFGLIDIISKLIFMVIVFFSSGFKVGLLLLVISLVIMSISVYVYSMIEDLVRIDYDNPSGIILLICIIAMIAAYVLFFLKL